MGEIRKNQQAKLLFTTAEGFEKELICSVKSFDNDRIVLNYPEETLDYLDCLQEGDEVQARIFTPLGVKVFDAIIINSPLEDDFVIEYSENPDSIQRRKFTRVVFRTKVIIERLGDEENIVTHTLDIGGGGLRFFYEGELKADEKVGVLLYLPFQIRSIKAKGIILNSDHLPENEYVLTFLDIEEYERDKIIKQCFEEQKPK